MLMIKVARGEGRINQVIKVIIDEICKIREGCEEIHMDQIYCEGNDMVDALAKLSNSVTWLTE